MTQKIEKEVENNKVFKKKFGTQTKEERRYKNNIKGARGEGINFFKINLYYNISHGLNEST